MALDVVTTQLGVMLIVALLCTLLIPLSGPAGNLQSDSSPVTTFYPCITGLYFPSATLFLVSAFANPFWRLLAYM